jgi:toxin YoeB
MNLEFSQIAWEDYLWFQQNEPKLIKKINRLIEESKRTPFEGTGKPEALKHDYAGFWSRRITDEHRIIYQVRGEQLFIASCRFHYE